MAKYKVEEVRDPRNHPQLGMTGKVIRSKVVDEVQVSATKADFRAGMRINPAKSSDSIRVTKA